MTDRRSALADRRLRVALLRERQKTWELHQEEARLFAARQETDGATAALQGDSDAIATARAATETTAARLQLEDTALAASRVRVAELDASARRLEPAAEAATVARQAAYRERRLAEEMAASARRAHVLDVERKVDRDATDRAGRSGP